MNALRHELPTAMRRLARAPGFSFAVVSFLGLSIAALLAVAAAVYGLMLRPLPYPDAERLVDVGGQSRAMSFSLGLSAPLIAELDETYDGLVALGAWERRRGEEGLEPTAVQPGVLAALGVAPRLGRAFEDATIASDEDAILISEGLWASRFARDPGVLGQSIDYAGRERRIVGVMPAAFRFPDGTANAWLPLHLTPADTAPQNAQVFGGLQVVARLAPDGSVAALDAALQARYGDDERIAGIREHMKLVFEAKPLREALARGKSELVVLLGIAVAVVLLTTLANLANLWLTRA
ncbi:MAG TPA: ABC transporter permease, partial [Candidatus Saccharimonadia bacterium]|nr:ABC transporter permease [Candidatus Saccharimonadia bacterium]